MNEILFKDISPDWLKILKKNISHIFRDDINDKDSNSYILSTEYTPSINDMFNFARFTPLDKIKIVILGQDPYHNGTAHGLAFSSMSKKIPASLQNIFKCLLKHNLITEIPTSANLTSWAEQGVLLLNTALTTERGVAGAHILYWEDYMIDLIYNISKIGKTRPIIFMLWGKNAQKFVNNINNKCHILFWTHPSPLGGSFIDCDNFIKANNILEEHNLSKINWNSINEIAERKTDNRDKNILNVENILNAENILSVENKTEKKSKEKKNKNTTVEKFLHIKDAFDADTIVAFSDGSCHPNKLCPEATAGWAIIFPKLGDLIIYGNLDNTEHFASNQRAEGYAIYRILKHTDDIYPSIEHKQKTLILITDSNFWIDMFCIFIPSWERNKSIDIDKKKNADIIKPAYYLFKKLSIEYGININFRHIRSHNKDKWNKSNKYSYEYFCYTNNEYVDKLSNYARINMKP